MDAENDQDLPDRAEDGGSKPGQESVQSVIGIGQTVCQNCGNRTDDNDGQRNHDHGAQERSANGSEGIRNNLFNFVFYPAENSYQYDRRDKVDVYVTEVSGMNRNFRGVPSLMLAAMVAQVGLVRARQHHSAI